jgi:hypothetical protein
VRHLTDLPRQCIRRPSSQASWTRYCKAVLYPKTQWRTVRLIPPARSGIVGRSPKLSTSSRESKRLRRRCQRVYLRGERHRKS